MCTQRGRLTEIAQRDVTVVTYFDTLVLVAGEFLSVIESRTRGVAGTVPRHTVCISRFYAVCETVVWWGRYF